MSTVIANTTCSVTLPGGLPRGVGEGDEYDSKDPIVREFGWLFDQPEIEQATAAPGEKRSAPKRKAARKK